MDLIRLPPPNEPYQPDDWPASGRRRRAAGWLAVLVALLLIMVVTLVNRQRSVPGPTGDGSPPGQPSQSSQPSDGSSADPNSGGSQLQPDQLVACPQILDEQSHLAYRCIDDYLRQDGVDIYLGLRIALNHEVEPGWVISEGSGDQTSVSPPNDTVLSQRQAVPISLAAGHRATGGGPVPVRVSPFGSAPAPAPTPGGSASPADVRREVQRRSDLALQKAYGDDPSARTLSAGPRTLAGVAGYELVTEITINPDYRQAHGLSVRTERLWVLGLPSPTGVSIFMMSIPDQRKDLWPRAEATVGTVHVI